ncbi:hypothetical protein PIB30_022716 [Stylosanthes scabra]|uniref:Uncharacterized protein n=1 Tax=Stylosanthes scabra TaxID=79078 RepID=A0ABU6YB80_9FABA|nr:hypothetical protein [Stylosanthes scabra]
MLIIYFHETQFGKNSREPIAQPPWIHYWNGRTLWDRMKQEKHDAAVSRSGTSQDWKAEKEQKQKKNQKKTTSSESEWEFESETDSEEYVSDESYEDSDSEETRSEELFPSYSCRPEHEPPQQPRQLEEETLIQQPQQQPPQPHQDEVIQLSSSSDDEQLPGHIEVLHPLVPKVEEHQTPNQEEQLPEVVEQPSQTVVEVV